MSKKNNTAEMIQKFRANCERLREIAEACEKEERVRTKEEDAEVKIIERENQIFEMRSKASGAEYIEKNGSAPDLQIDKVIRENVAKGGQVMITLSREVVTVQDAINGGLVAVKTQDIVGPMEEALIYHKVGLPFLTGLSGQFVWPVVEAVHATIAGDHVKFADSKVNLKKLTAQPQRIGCAIPVGRDTIEDTNGIIKDIVINKLVPQGVAWLINRVLFGTTKACEAATTLVGPFVGKKLGAKKFAGAVPTFTELNLMKADALKAGARGEHMCYIMSYAMKCILEGTPKSDGAGIYICENDRIAGLPVYATSEIGDDYVGLGDWTYQPTGLFGAMSFIIDPYSKARENSVDFVYNARCATTTLLDGAFVLRQITPGA